MRLRDLPHRFAARIVPFLGAAYVRLVKACVRWTWHGRPEFDEVVASNAPVIVAFWHGRILLMPPMIEETTLNVKVMISANRDGDMISRTIGYFGADTIRGSTRDPRKGDKNKGGRMAIREALDQLAGGGVVAITPDGPRGPRMRARPGIASISIQSGIPVLPCAASTRYGKILRSWDRFHVPLPWGRGCVVTGPLLHPPAEGDEESQAAYLDRIETTLTEITRRADAEVGRSTPEPGPKLVE